MKFILLLFFLLTVWLPSAAQKPGTNVNTAGQVETSVAPVIKYEYSGAFSYKIDVANDRTLVYEGIYYVKTKGKIVTKITDVQLQQMSSAFKNAGFVTLRDSYTLENGCTVGSSDAPWVKLTLRSGKTVKSIDHFLGCSWGNKKYVRGMKALTRLENRIHEILNIDQWIGTEEERSKLPHPLAKPPKDL